MIEIFCLRKTSARDRMSANLNHHRKNDHRRHLRRSCFSIHLNQNFLTVLKAYTNVAGFPTMNVYCCGSNCCSKDCSTNCCDSALCRSSYCLRARYYCSIRCYDRDLRCSNDHRSCHWFFLSYRSKSCCGCGRCSCRDSADCFVMLSFHMQSCSCLIPPLYNA